MSDGVARQGSTTGWTAALLALCAVLAAIVAAEIASRRPPAMAGSTMPAAATHTTAAKPMPPRVPPPAAFHEIVARPLFTPSRRPAAVAPRGATALPPMILSGVVIGGGQRLAILQIGNPPRLLRVVEGQDVEGWKVAAIAAGHVVLKNGEATAELALKDAPPPGQRSPRNAAPPSAAARPAR